MTGEPPIVRVGRYRWMICALLFAATAINYIDRQTIGVLKPTLQSFGRVEWQGVGSIQPRYPLDTPENRARNRRVEIIHTARSESLR